MSEYIEREKLLSDVDAAMENAGMGYVIGQTMKRYIKRVPYADVAPARHGRWRKGGYVCGETEWECSACGETEWRTSSDRLKYRPFCGAKMDLEVPENETL